MDINSYAFIATAVFSAIAAVSAAVSVTKGAIWAALALDRLDPMKQRLSQIRQIPAREDNKPVAVIVPTLLKVINAHDNLAQ